MTGHDWLLLVPVSCLAVLLGLTRGRRAAGVGACALGGVALAFAALSGARPAWLFAAFCIHAVGTLVGVALLPRLVRAHERKAWIHVGLAVAVAQASAAMLLVLVLQSLADDVGASRLVLFAGAQAVAAFAVALGVAPNIERRLGWVTRVLLADLAQPFGSPLVAQLQAQAPSVFAMSRRASEIAAAAGEVVGADGLAIRAAAMHADVGRLACARNAGLASASQKPALELSPELESLVEFDHVKDSVAICRDHDMPSVLTAIVAEHHGTMVRRQAFEAARELRSGRGELIPVEAFRYPGPKPSTKESAAVQAGWFLAERSGSSRAVEELADAVEAGEWANCGLSAAERSRLLQAAERCAIELSSEGVA